MQDHKKHNIEKRMMSVELPKRKKNRLIQYDYSSANAYFITICTDKRRCLFWDNAVSVAECLRRIPLSPWGRIAEECILEIPKRYPSISVDHYVVMPNHTHLLLQIHSSADGRPMVAPTISTVVKQMKGVVSKKLGDSIWQKGFYDHVVRGEADYQEIWNYIAGNPGTWMEDKLYTNSFP